MRLLATLLLASSNSMWSLHNKTNADMVARLGSEGLIVSSVVARAMLLVDRRNYCQVGDPSPYEDAPSHIGYGATISAPHMHARCLEAFVQHATQEDAHILDVGSGSGYLSVVFGRMNTDAKVFGIDLIPELVQQSITNVKKVDKDLLDSGKLQLLQGDGWAGLPSEGPFDVIHVGAAAATIPRSLISQLKIGGRAILPVGPVGQIQQLTMIDRVTDGSPEDAGAFIITPLLAVQYVPLVEKGK